MSHPRHRYRSSLPDTNSSSEDSSYLPDSLDDLMISRDSSLPDEYDPAPEPRTPVPGRTNVWCHPDIKQEYVFTPRDLTDGKTAHTQYGVLFRPKALYDSEREIQTAKNILSNNSSGWTKSYFQKRDISQTAKNTTSTDINNFTQQMKLMDI